MPIEERIAAALPATIKTSSYAILSGDVGREIQFQSTSPLTGSLPPVGLVGNGFNVVLRNIGAGLLTVQPVVPELIDGNASISLNAGDWHWIRSDGTEWKSVAVNATGTGTVTQIDTAGGLTGGPITNTGIVSIADDGVTLAKMAGGTAGNLISYDANGDPAYVATGNNGEVLTSQGAGLPPIFAPVSAGGGLQSVQVFTTNGTWTKPVGINFLKITVVGGGGGGGSNSAGTSGGSGGGGGAAIRWMDASLLPPTVAVTVGSGGSGAAAGSGNNGTGGGSSSFGSFASATGGGFGRGNTGAGGPFGSGGIGTGGDLNIAGGAGGAGGIQNNSGITGNVGGSSLFGANGAGTWNAIGRDGGNYGGGGSGGGANSPVIGGNGADGVVFVEEYA